LTCGPGSQQSVAQVAAPGELDASGAATRSEVGAGSNGAGQGSGLIMDYDSGGDPPWRVLAFLGKPAWDELPAALVVGASFSRHAQGGGIWPEFEEDWLELGRRVACSFHYQHPRNLRLLQAAQAEQAVRRQARAITTRAMQS
jgi:hypothetical protein